MAKNSFPQIATMAISVNGNYGPQSGGENPNPPGGTMEYQDFVGMEYEDLDDMDFEQ